MKFFPQRPAGIPTVYAYELPGVASHKGCIKIGFTTREAKSRIEEQLKTARLKHNILWQEPAMREDGSSFTDHDLHRYLDRRKTPHVDGEWYRCTLDDVKAAYLAVRHRTENEESRTQDFGLRPEQEAAIAKTEAYFRAAAKDMPGTTPHFLWNAKMRFGKTFTTYQLARRMGWKRVLVLTFKPAVEDAWREDLLGHVDFEGWQFLSRTELESGAKPNLKKPLVCFGSFQDYLGKSAAGGIKAKNQWVHDTDWDCIVFDEYHYGAWRENARDLCGADTEATKELDDWRKVEKEGLDKEAGVDALEDSLPITARHYLYLSGTPFRAISSGEFIEEQIYNWTYSDEQREKAAWPAEAGPNPYAALPRMVLLTYQLPDAIRQIAMEGEFDGFNLNTFFEASGKGADAVFKNSSEVQQWLDLLRGGYTETVVSDLKLKKEKPLMPFAHKPLLEVLNHTLWFLPNVAACHAMANLLKERQNTFYRDYEIVVAAGNDAGMGADALTPVEKAMTGNPLATKTITLTCGKLTTGVSVKPWTGILMLRNASSPETYFQAAFRVQTPWEVAAEGVGESSGKEKQILKKECYVFDFAPDRALRQIADYCGKLGTAGSNPEKNVAEFINFLPVLAYDGSSMRQIDAGGILDMAMSGTTATLLARRWESALLVNVDNGTLGRVMGNEEAMKALMSIEGFRNLNQDIETIINKSEAVKKVKKEAGEEGLSPKQKKALTEEEKEYKSLRKQIQEKLIKFATRIPVFMYLTDYRENSLEDVIQQIEPGLFRKVTGLDVKDFALLKSLGLFNAALMNDAVFKFRRYEDASLSYSGLDRHEGERVGGYNTVVSRKDFNRGFVGEE